MKKIISLIIVVTLFPFNVALAAPATMTITIENVYDGDTYNVTIDGEKEKLSWRRGCDFC